MLPCVASASPLMASSLRTPTALRCLAHATPARSPRCLAAHPQRRWARVNDVHLRARFLATSQDPLDKYREKLRQKAASEGHASIDDLKAAYAERIQEQRRRDALTDAEHATPESPTPTPSPTSSSPSSTATSTSTPTPTSTSTSTSASASTSSSSSSFKTKTSKSTSGKPAVKPLSDILDLDKAAALPEKELTAIWRLRHASSPQALCAVIPAPTYRAMEALARSSPQFVLPVPHPDQGAEMHFLQWTFDAASRTSTVLFTQLLEFKSRGEFAQPHTTVTHHLDLADDKGLVLMQGHVVEGRGVMPEHAKWLLLCLQRFYGGWESGAEGETTAGGVDSLRRERAEERRRLLEWFTKGDPRFSVEKLIEEAERMG